VIFDFVGFFSPVDNPPVINLATAGRVVPVKFTLGGDQGLNIFASGYPSSRQIACETGATLDLIEETIPASSSQLVYKPETGVYQYAWKAPISWRNTCRQLTVVLVDGTTHVAFFRFR
jgi:hypothetical protein